MWTPPPPPPAEAERLAELRSYDLLDTLPDERFDRIARIAARACGADVAFVSLMDARQQWMKSRTTDALHEHVARDRSICTMVVASEEELVIEDMRTAPELEGHPIARQMPWRFYAGVPLRGEQGNVIGTLCVLGTEAGAPAAFSREVLRDLAAISSEELSLARRNAELHRLSNTDALTGLANRRMFDEEFGRASRRARRTGEPVSLLLLDLDHFKEVNDTLGHEAGDRSLAAFAAFLSAFARRPDDLAARIGGEEFALVLAGTDGQGAAQVATRFLVELAEAALPHPRRGRLSSSIGMATLEPDEELASWQKRADRGLYAAKTAGRATVRAG